MPTRADHRLTAMETAAEADKIALDPDKDAEINWQLVAHLNRQALIHALLALSADGEQS